MNIRFILMLVCALWLLTGCSSKTTIVLLPDNEGKVGEVVLHTLTGARTLSEAGASTSSGSYILPPGSAMEMDEGTIEQKHGVTLDNEPDPPLKFTFHFLHDSVELVPSAESRLSAAIEGIKKRESCDIISAGHTDSVGDLAYNIRLSYRRAVKVKEKLIDLGISSKCVETTSYGELDPAVKTADNVSERRNRRVELYVR